MDPTTVLLLHTGVIVDAGKRSHNEGSLASNLGSSLYWTKSYDYPRVEDRRKELSCSLNVPQGFFEGLITVHSLRYVLAEI